MSGAVPMLGQGMTMSTVSFGHQKPSCTTRLTGKPVQRVVTRTSAGVVAAASNAEVEKRRQGAQDWIAKWRKKGQNGVAEKAPVAKASQAAPAAAITPPAGGNGKVSNWEVDGKGYILFTEGMLKADSLS